MGGIKCRKGLVIFYGILVSIYFGTLFPMQLKELIELRNKEQIQQNDYEEYRQEKKYYDQIRDYEELLYLQIKSYEKEFLKYENDYIGTEKLRLFFGKYPIQNLRVIRKGCEERVEEMLTLREEIYQITYESTFYESYEIIQNLLSVTGASHLQKILMSNLNKPLIQTDLMFIFRLEGEKDEGKDKKV